MAASVSVAFPATAPPAGPGRSQPSSVCLRWSRRRVAGLQEPPRRLVAVAARRRYKGTVQKEAALAALIERKVAEAMAACDGQRGPERDEGCRVAWDEVEEVSQAKADLRRRVAEAPDDPLEPFCAHNPTADDCAVVYVDD